MPFGDWHLPPTRVYFHVRVRISLYSNGWIIECRSVFLSTIIAPVCVTDCSFALSLQQHLARSAIRVAHDDRAALFSVD